MKDHVARIRIIVDISLCTSFESLGRGSTYGPSRRSEGARCFVKDTTGSVWVWVGVCAPYLIARLQRSTEASRCGAGGVQKGAILVGFCSTKCCSQSGAYLAHLAHPIVCYSYCSRVSLESDGWFNLVVLEGNTPKRSSLKNDVRFVPHLRGPLSGCKTIHTHITSAMGLCQAAAAVAVAPLASMKRTTSL